MIGKTVLATQNILNIPHELPQQAAVAIDDSRELELSVMRGAILLGDAVRGLECNHTVVTKEGMAAYRCWRSTYWNHLCLLFSICHVVLTGFEVNSGEGAASQGTNVLLQSFEWVFIFIYVIDTIMYLGTHGGCKRLCKCGKVRPILGSLALLALLSDSVVNTVWLISYQHPSFRFASIARSYMVAHYHASVFSLLQTVAETVRRIQSMLVFIIFLLVFVTVTFVTLFPGVSLNSDAFLSLVSFLFFLFRRCF